MLTGGFSEQELADAGAVKVFDSIDDLRGSIDGAARGRSAARWPIGRAPDHFLDVELAPGRADR